jgi:hypothetical protein
MRGGLFAEIVRMSWETVRGNKMRSFLTVLGIVIGITSIVGMTSLIRGFDENFKDSIKSIGPDVVYISKFSGLSFAGGKSFQELMKRPNLSPEDAAAIERDAPSIGVVDIILGQGGARRVNTRASAPSRSSRSAPRNATCASPTSTSRSAATSRSPKCSTAARWSCSARPRTPRSFRMRIRSARPCAWA